MIDQPPDLAPEQQLELAKYEAEQETQRHTNRWTAFKAIGVALVGTATVGLASIYVNHQFQSGQLEIEREKTNRTLKLEEKQFAASDRDAIRLQQQKYLQTFSKDALSIDIQHRIDFAHYVSKVTLDKQMRDLWKIYHGELEVELTETRADLKAKNEQLEALSSGEGAENKEKISKLEAIIARLNTRIDSGFELAKSPLHDRADFQGTRSANGQLLVILNQDNINNRLKEICTVDLSKKPAESTNKWNCHSGVYILDITRIDDNNFKFDYFDLSGSSYTHKTTIFPGQTFKWSRPKDTQFNEAINKQLESLELPPIQE